MEYIVNILNEQNKDCNFCNKIKQSEYSEKKYLNTEKEKNNNKKYHNFLLCILDNFDLILSNSNDKKIDFPKRVLEICSQIEEDKNSYYDKFNYNKKFSLKKIQNSLQICSNKGKLLSSIFYLNDYYSTHFVIVDINKKQYMETTNKNYPKQYLEFDNRFFRLCDSLNENFEQTDNLDLFEEDINNIYNNYLKSLGNYKLDDLKNICNELNLSFYNGSKIMKKKDIYDMINLYKMHN